MLDKEKAAKMFIVAWVKNWYMRTLLDVITEESVTAVTEERLAKVVEAFPFMPSTLSFYIANSGCGRTMRVSLPSINKKLNDALWDAKDNKARLDMYKYVMGIKTGKAIHKRKFDTTDQITGNAIRKESNAEYTSYKLSREAFKKAQGHDWNTVK